MGAYSRVGLIQEGGLLKRGEYKQSLVAVRIPFSTVTPISHFLMLQMEVVGRFLKDIRFFIN